MLPFPCTKNTLISVYIYVAHTAFSRVCMTPGGGSRRNSFTRGNSFTSGEIVLRLFFLQNFKFVNFINLICSFKLTFSSIKKNLVLHNGQGFYLKQVPSLQLPYKGFKDLQTKMLAFVYILYTIISAHAVQIITWVLSI